MYTHLELEIKKLQITNQVKIRVSRKPQVPRIFFKKIYNVHSSPCAARITGSNQKEARYLSSPAFLAVGPVYRLQGLK